MIRIALCEDDAVQRRLMAELLDGYAAQKEQAVRVWVFSSGRELLASLYDELFDIYVLDIVMPHMDGIRLGSEIRKTDRSGSIIYLTSSPDFALESYRTKASAYLLKPVVRQELFAALDDAAALHFSRWENSIAVKTHDGLLRLPTDEIFYAELNGRSIRYCLRGGYVDSMTIATSFREAAAPLLKEKHFLLCGSSFVVNLHYVRMVEKQGVYFVDGKHLTLPKSACAPLRGAWTDYWLGGGSS